MLIINISLFHSATLSILVIIRGKGSAITHSTIESFWRPNKISAGLGISDQSPGEDGRWYRQRSRQAPKHNEDMVYSFEIRGGFSAWFSADYTVTFASKKAKHFLLAFIVSIAISTSTIVFEFKTLVLHIKSGWYRVTLIGTKRPMHETWDVRTVLF